MKLLQNPFLMEEKEKQEGVGCLKSGEGAILRGNRTWKVETQRRLKYFIYLLKSGPVCLPLGRAESHSVEGCFCLAKCLEAVLPGLIYEDEIGTHFFSTLPLSLRIC